MSKDFPAPAYGRATRDTHAVRGEKSSPRMARAVRWSMALFNCVAVECHVSCLSFAVFVTPLSAWQQVVFLKTRISGAQELASHQLRRHVCQTIFSGWGLQRVH